MLRVVAILPERAYVLRQEVLRPHQSVEEMGCMDSGEPGGLVVGALSETGEVVATGAVAPGTPPDDVAALAGAGPYWRLRGMATRPDARSKGIGTAVLGALIDHARTHGARVMWCNAREPARALYERAGLQVIGDAWVDPLIGPHIVMWGPLGPGDAVARR